jgi:hypothetical protein
MTCTNSKVQKIQPTYIDEFDIDHDPDQDRFEEIESDVGTLPATSFAASGSSSSRRPPPKSTPRACPRRELIWKYQKHETVSLENIASQFQDFLRTSSAQLAFNHRRGRYTTKTAHRCPGYNRIEITLTTDIARSAIVSHLTPTPHEICPVCKETVKDAEIFACICGGDGEFAHKHKPSSCVLELTSRADIESIPTIRCSTCSEWHHRPCVNIFEDENWRFECQHCQAGPPTPQGLSSSFIDPANFSPGHPYPSIRIIIDTTSFPLTCQIGMCLRFLRYTSQSRYSPPHHPQSPSGSANTHEKRSAVSVKGTTRRTKLVNQKSGLRAVSVGAAVWHYHSSLCVHPTHAIPRIGHPSCMALERLGEVLRSYPWKFIECKNCEVCMEIGDDVSLPISYSPS